MSIVLTTESSQQAGRHLSFELNFETQLIYNDYNVDVIWLQAGSFGQNSFTSLTKHNINSPIPFSISCGTAKQKKPTSKPGPVLGRDQRRKISDQKYPQTAIYKFRRAYYGIREERREFLYGLKFLLKLKFDKPHDFAWTESVDTLRGGRGARGRRRAGAYWEATKGRQQLEEGPGSGARPVLREPERQGRSYIQKTQFFLVTQCELWHTALSHNIRRSHTNSQ